MTDSFVHLHLHTEYSMLDGASRIDDVVNAAIRDGMPAVGITDHGNMYGVLELYKSARKEGIKPVLGMEGYFTSGSRFDRPKRAENEIFHLTMLAENNVGYHNLIKVSSAAYMDGYYYKPRSDWDLLERHHEGIIATSGCLGGLVSQLILKGELEAAYKAAGRFQDIFGRDNFFVEIQDHGIDDQVVTIKPLLDIARRLNAPLLATNDSHYTDREGADAHDALLCVQTGALKSDTKRFKFDGEDFYIKSAVEMRDLFVELPEACDNTLWVAERAEVEINFDNAVLPQFPVPDGHDQDSYLRELVFEGAKDRYGQSPAMHVFERLEFELDVIKTMGFSAYFLVVWDLVRYAKSHNIRVGPGRGSAAGSGVAYCLRIVDIDPIKYDLLFERFLNPGRTQMPDIDMDFDSRYRGDMIKYAAQKYGSDRVAQIVTFSTIKARAAVRDAARVLDYPYAVGDKIAKAMPPLIMGRDTPLQYCFEESEKYADGYKMATDLRQMYGEDPDVKRIVDVARGLEGLRRQDGIHAAAVVITRDSLTEYLPIQRKPGPGGDVTDSPVVTQYEMHGVEELGLLKMDFLGLRNLDVMEIALDLIEASTGMRPNIDDPPLDDAATFALLQRADTIGVFQLEGGPMRALIQRLAPTSFEDVAALVALYRPGPMAQNWHNEYADRKNGRKPVVFDHESLEEILGPTYGLMIYQEQLMRVSQKLAGYTLEEADNLRKATGKKIRAMIAKERTKFVAGCIANGHSEKFAEDYFDTVEPFADYSFNKSHSVGYGFVSYQTAYLKANFPVQYLAALLTSVKTNLEKAAVYINECRLLDISVLNPCVNDSVVDFSVRFNELHPQGAIRFGMSAVRNVGEGVAEQVVLAREEGGPFSDFHDFCERVDMSALNKRTVESLIKAGGFDNLGHRRRGLLAVFEPIIEQATKRRREREQGTMSFFDLDLGGGDDGAATGTGGGGFEQRMVIPDLEFEKMQRLALEKEMLGLYVSDHPLMGAKRQLDRLAECSVADFAEFEDGTMRTVAGIVTALNRKYTKRGDLMATFIFEDLSGSLEAMVFPKTMLAVGPKLADDTIVVIKARLDRRDDAPKLIVMDVTVPEIFGDTGPPVRLMVRAGAFDEAKVNRLKELLCAHPGESNVFVHITSMDRETVLKLDDNFNCDASTGLFAELRVAFGADSVR